MNQAYLKHTDGFARVEAVRYCEEPPGCMSADGTLCTAKEEEGHQCFIRRGLVAARFISRPLWGRCTPCCTWAGFGLILQTCRRSSTVCVVTFRDTCRIVDTYRVVVCWKRRVMLERAVCETERGDTEPGTAFVFTCTL